MNSPPALVSSWPRSRGGQADRLVGARLGIVEQLAQAVRTRPRRRRELGDDRQVVHAHDVEVEVEEAHVEELRQRELRARDLVAQPDRLDRRLARHRAAQRGHRVGDVEHPRVGTELFHVAGDADEHGDVAQRAHDPARADGVADRLLDAVPLRDLEVVAHALEPAGGDGDDDVVGAGQRGALVGGGSTVMPMPR